MTSPLESLWQALQVRSKRLARLLPDPPTAEDEAQLWAEFVELVDAPTLVLSLDGQRLALTKHELILVGSTAAVAVGLGDQVLGDMPLGLAALTVTDALALLDPRDLVERLDHLRYLGGGGRLLEAGILAVGKHDSEADAGSILMADLVITGTGLRVLLAAC